MTDDHHQAKNLKTYFWSVACFVGGMVWAFGPPGAMIAIGAVSMLGCFGAFLLSKIKGILDERAAR